MNEVDLRQFFTYGPGSIGESTRVLAKDFTIFSKNQRPTSNEKVFNVMYDYRKALTRQYNLRENLTERMSYAEFKSKSAAFFPGEEEDLPLFIFKVLYFEQENYRKAIDSVPDKSTLYLILEIVHEESSKFASNGTIIPMEAFIVLTSQYLPLWLTHAHLLKDAKPKQDSYYSPYWPFKQSWHASSDPNLEAVRKYEADQERTTTIIKLVLFVILLIIIAVNTKC